jgi:predicted nuclease of predicted toxin-antitoxin system
MIYASVDDAIIEVTDADFGSVSVGTTAPPIKVKIRNIRLELIILSQVIKIIQ